MSNPPPPKPGEQLRYRAIGHALTHVNTKGRRQVRWEDGSTNYVAHPGVLKFKDKQRFECQVVYTYTGKGFECSEINLEHVNPIADFILDPAESQRLWDSVVGGNVVKPEPPEVDEDFWLKPEQPK